MPVAMPQDIHPDLTNERLIIIANTIRQSRRDTIKTAFNPGKGDDPWTLGCVGYKRACFSISALPQIYGPEADWVRVITPPLKFVFSLGLVPVRFFRGDPHAKQAPENQITQSEAEREAQFALALNDRRRGNTNIIHRLVVKYDPKSYHVDRVWLAQFNERGWLAEEAWEIPDVPMPIKSIRSIESADPVVEVKRADVEPVMETIHQEEEEVRKEGA